VPETKTEKLPRNPSNRKEIEQIFGTIAIYGRIWLGESWRSVESSENSVEDLRPIENEMCNMALQSTIGEPHWWSMGASYPFHPKDFGCSDDRTNTR
jgi:hypothetical protein